MDMGTCCAYFCTGVSFFGIITLAAISAVLSGKGAHYVSEEFAARHGEEAPLSSQEALKACYMAMCIYAVFLLGCGFNVFRMNRKSATKQLLDE